MRSHKRGYIFVDGENHFIRSTRFLERLHGSPLAAQAVAQAITNHTVTTDMVPSSCSPPVRFLYDESTQVFWDRQFLRIVRNDFFSEILRAVYVTAIQGGTDVEHDANEQLRRFGFEPIVIKEKKDSSDRVIPRRLLAVLE